MKAKELERQLLQDGCVLVSKKGDHHTWKLPNGRTFDVPFGGKHTEAKKWLQRKYLKIAAEAGDTK